MTTTPASDAAQTERVAAVIEGELTAHPTLGVLTDGVLRVPVDTGLSQRIARAVLADPALAARVHLGGQLEAMLAGAQDRRGPGIVDDLDALRARLDPRPPAEPTADDVERAAAAARLAYTGQDVWAEVAPYRQEDWREVARAVLAVRSAAATDTAEEATHG